MDNNNYIAYELSKNILSSMDVEKPLKNWFIVILLPVLLINMMLVMVLINDYSTNSLIISFITIVLCCLCFCRTMFLRTLRVDAYIDRKQEFFQIIKNYCIENNKDVNNEQFLALLNNIDVFCLVKKRLTFVLFSLFIVVLISIKVIFIFLGYFLIAGLIILILFTYYLYLANNIWQEIFSMEKSIYILLYSYLDMPEEYHVKALDIPIKYTSFIVNMFLTIISLGIYGLYWDYLFHTAPDKTFPYIHEAEEDIFNKIMENNSKPISN